MDNLPIPVVDLKTTKRFPPSLRGTVYEKMLEAISDELSIWRDSIRFQKTSFYDIDKTDKARLSAICQTLEAPLDVQIKNNIEFVREETRSIPFKIYYKGTPTLYKSFCYAVDRFGEMFVYIYRKDEQRIVRSMLLPFDSAEVTPQNLPFRHLSRGDFSGTIVDWLQLDTGLFLDAGDAMWRLDSRAVAITTNHIGIEYFIDRIINRKDTTVTGEVIDNEYLMTKEYLNYLNRAVERGRRAKEVPHIGSQLSIQTDVSGLCNAYDSTQDYTIPSLKLYAVARPDYFSIVLAPQSIGFVEFGVGRREVASIQNPTIPFPSDLESKVFSKKIPFYDHYDNTKFVGAVGEYLGQSLNGFRMLDGTAFDGVTQDFEFTLPFAPIQRGNITLEFHLPSGEILSITDNKRGVLLSPYGYGTVDYLTGNCHITTRFEYPSIDDMDAPVPVEGTPDSPDSQTDTQDTTNGRTHFIHTLVHGDSVVPGSVWLTFTTGIGVEQRTYTVNDDGNGQFVHDLIESGTIDYSEKLVDVLFRSPLVDIAIKPFICKYSSPVDYCLSSGSELFVSYMFTQQSIYITEAGFRSVDGELLSYATFPPMEFNSTAYHLNFMVLVRKP